MEKIMFLLLLSCFFLGCSTKKDSFRMNQYMITKNETMNLLSDTLDLKTYYAEAVSYPQFGGILKEKLVDFLIHNIAQKTIDYRKKYFFIVYPKEVSNYEGRIINNLRDFKENFNYERSSKIRKCSNRFECPSLKIELVFVMLDEKSMDYIVWDAKKVLAN